MIEATELGVDETLALRVIATAKTIAPCLDQITDLYARKSIVAILKGVAADVRPRTVKSERVGGISVEYDSPESWFSTDDRDALRQLCGITSGSAAPVGHFPQSSRILGLWPERYDTA